MTKPFSAMPAPPGSLVFGHVRDIRKDMLGFYERCAREHGDLVRNRFFHIKAVQVSDPELIGEVLIGLHDQLIKPWDFEQLRMVVGNGLLTNEGEDHRRQRRLIAPSFSHEKVRAYGDVMVARAERRIAGWVDGETRDLHAEMSRVTLEIVCEALFGVGIDDKAELIQSALDVFMISFEGMFTSALPLPLTWPTPTSWRLRRAVRGLDDVVLDMIDRRRQRPGDKGDDLLGRMLVATDEHGGMSDAQLRDELLTLLLAGHETTALALTWTLLLLSQNPDEEARVTDELARVLDGRTPRFEDVPALAHVRRVVDEGLRLYPPAWGIGRAVRDQPVELGGYLLPKATQIFMLPWVTHKDPRFFTDPLAFRPDRFLKPVWPKHAYFPFAEGPRSCIGMHFALMEAVLVLATVMQRFHVDVVPGRVELMPAVTLRPRHGLPAVLRRRTPQRAVFAA